MKETSIRLDRKNKTVTIVMPLEKAQPSRSTGKTQVIATTGGLKTSEESYSHRPVCFTANVFFFPLKKQRNEPASIGEESNNRNRQRNRTAD